MEDDKRSDKLAEAIETKFRDMRLEKEITAYLLRKNVALAPLVEPEWFSSAPLGNLVSIVQKHKTLLSKNTFRREIKRKNLGEQGKVYLGILDEVFNVNLKPMNDKSVRIAVDDLLELSESRRILYGVRDIAVQARNGRFSVVDIKSTLRELGRGLTAKCKSSGDYLARYETRRTIVRERSRKRSQGEEVGVLTGIGVFDRMFGGLVNGEFGVVAGQPAIGKTATLLSFAVNAWMSGKCGIFVTGEMPQLDIELRIDAMISRISSTDYRLGSLSKRDYETWDKSIRKERQRKQNYLEVVSFPKGFTMSDVDSGVMEIEETHKRKIDFICLDYINIVHPKEQRQKGSRNWESQADVVWEFKEFVAEQNIVGWTAGQVVDEAVDVETLQLSHLKYSRAISETAPVVVGLVRTQREEYEHLMELQILKMRNAKLPNQHIVLRPNLDFGWIHEDVIDVKDMLQMDDELVPKQSAKKKGRRG